MLAKFWDLYIDICICVTVVFKVLLIVPKADKLGPLRLRFSARVSKGLNLLKYILHPQMELLINEKHSTHTIYKVDMLKNWVAFPKLPSVQHMQGSFQWD